MTETQFRRLLALLCFALAALLQASAAGAQERKVWRDADLAQPAPRRPLEPSTLPGLRARSLEGLPTPLAGGCGCAPQAAGALAQRDPGAYYSPSGRAPEPSSYWPAQEGMLYASQPLWPFVTVIYSRRGPEVTPYGYPRLSQPHQGQLSEHFRRR